MRRILLTATALSMLSGVAFAQTSNSGSASTAINSSGLAIVGGFQSKGERNWQLGRQRRLGQHVGREIRCQYAVEFRGVSQSDADLENSDKRIRWSDRRQQQRHQRRRHQWRRQRRCEWSGGSHDQPEFELQW